MSFLEALLTEQDVLIPGQDYTFTVDGGQLLYGSDQDLFEKLKTKLINYANIISLTRPLFSGRYVIIIRPKEKLYLTQWKSVIDAAFKSLNYSNAVLVQAETGVESTKPGGIPEILPKSGEILGKSLAELLKPLIPYLIIGTIGLIAISYMKKGR